MLHWQLWFILSGVSGVACLEQVFLIYESSLKPSPTFSPGLAHLIGSSLLRAYMHGFFMDIRLYHKVNKATVNLSLLAIQFVLVLVEVMIFFGELFCGGDVFFFLQTAISVLHQCCFLFPSFFFLKARMMANPFAYEEYRREKIRQKIEETRAQRVQLKVNPLNKEGELLLE